MLRGNPNPQYYAPPVGMGPIGTAETYPSRNARLEDHGNHPTAIKKRTPLDSVLFFFLLAVGIKDSFVSFHWVGLGSETQ